METLQRRSPLSGLMDRMVQLVCFLVMSTVAMATIGIAVLVQPLAQTFSDNQTIKAHQENIEELSTLKAQQQELLANAGQSVIVERAAINHLHYRPAHVAQGDQISLSGSWPDLEAALAGVFSAEEPAATPRRYQRWVQSLAGKPGHQDLLLVLGCVLAVVSLTFFNRRA